MKFPPKPKGMDTAFYRQLLAWKEEVERVAYSRRTTTILTSPQVPQVRRVEPVEVMDAPEDLTLTEDDLGMTLVLKATADIDVTLPGSFDGGWVKIVNYGSSVVTVKNAAAATIGTLRQYQRTHVESWPDADGIFAWPTKIVVFGADGSVFLENDLYFRVASKGVVFTDVADSNKIRQTVNTDAAVLTDTGASEGSVAEPE